MVVAGTTFVKTASLVASWAGVPDLPVAEYSGAIQLHTDAEIRENLEGGVLDHIIEGLARSAKTSGVDSGAALKHADEIVFRGTLDEVTDFFAKNNWTDGCPIIPPTPEKVAEFLKYTDRSPDDGIAVLPQANLRATARNIAVNAVMAGCRPEFMPLLIAAVEAAGDPDFQLVNIGSTGNKIPWLLISGPIVKQLGIAYGVGSRSVGPNPAIGRAFHLILGNVAGFRYGETLMATWGGHTPYVLAEDEDACGEIGWQTYGVEKGFDSGASLVTARTSVYWGGQGRPTSWGGVQPALSEKEMAASLLEIARMQHRRQVMVENSLRFGERNNVAVLVTPPTAKALAKGGYSKQDVALYLWEKTRLTVREADQILQNFTGYGLTVHELVEEGTLPGWFDGKPDEMIPYFSRPGLLDVVVCGDAHKDKIMTLWANYNRPVTRKVEFPAAGTAC